MTASVEIGRIYDGRVMSIKDFGAFIEILPGKDGLCHISELADGYVNSVADVCKVGDEMQVKVIAIDDQDRVKLSRKAVLREQAAAEKGGSQREIEMEGGMPCLRSRRPLRFHPRLRRPRRHLTGVRRRRYSGGF